MSYEIVAGMITIVGFILTISKPIVKLTQQITELNVNVNRSTESLVINPKDMKNIEIDLPSLDEQKRIAEEITILEASIERRKNCFRIIVISYNILKQFLLRYSPFLYSKISAGISLD